METTDLLTLIGAVGGIQGIIELIKWWRGRKLRDRKEIADVEASENENRRKQIDWQNENQRKQIDWLEARLADRDAKIDRIYAELRAEQAKRLDEVHRRHEVELKLAEMEVKKCNIRGCGDRTPPSGY